MPRLGDLFAPRDRAYFELFEEAGQNVVLAAELLERMMANSSTCSPILEKTSLTSMPDLPIFLNLKGDP